MILQFGVKFNEFDWWKRAMWSDLRGYLLLHRDELAEQPSQTPPLRREGHTFGRPPDLKLVPREGEHPHA